MISYLASVSVSLRVVVPCPVVSRLLISICSQAAVRFDMSTACQPQCGLLACAVAGKAALCIWPFVQGTQPSTRYRDTVCRQHSTQGHSLQAHLHVLELDAHEQEVDLANHGVPQVVAPLVVLELDVQAVLDAHLHLRTHDQV